MKITPQRITLSRKKGFNLQRVSLELNGLPAVNCARPSKWGNRYKIGSPGIDTASHAKIAFFNYTWRTPEGIELSKDAKRILRGKNLACWCPHFKCDKCGDTSGTIDGVMCLKSNRSGTRWCRGVVRKMPCHADVLLQIANE